MEFNNVGLVLEGGAMRGMFTAGVLDVLMENDVYINNCVGISAGAVFGCNYKSRQIGRTIRYNKAYCRNKSYCSLRSLIFTGDLYGADFGYRRIPFELDPFDTKTFTESKMNFHVGVTNVETGKCEFYKCTDGGEKDLLYMRASASMPVVSRVVEVDGKKFLDGGCSDAIPLDYMQSLGFKRNVLLLTQPAGFVKEINKQLPIIRRMYGMKYPALVEAMETRHTRYNACLAEIEKCRADGSAFVIQPPCALGVKAVEKDPNELERVYQIGRKTGEEILQPLKNFLTLE